MNGKQMEHRKVLVLNRGWTALHTITLAKALVMVFNERARIVDPEDYQAMTWSDWTKLEPLGDDAIRSANMVFRVPEVIVLNQYDKLPKPRRTVSRRMLFRRDASTCQYCGGKPGTEELTIDHVRPRCQGGTTTWENAVVACVECNSRKANRTPEQAGMTLRKRPTAPAYKMLRFENIRIDSWSKFIGEAFWNCPLEE